MSRDSRLRLEDIIDACALERDLAAPADDATMRRARASRLFAALDQSRNTQPVGGLNRDEIYDRPVLR